MSSDNPELTNLKVQITHLRQEIKKLERKPSDDAKEAKQASKMCSEYRNRCLESQKIIDEISQSTSSKLSLINTNLEEIKEQSAKINGIGASATASLSEIEDLKEKVGLVQELFDEKDSLDEKIESLTELHDTGKDISSKINILHSLSRNKKHEIDELYYKIYGYEEDSDEENEEDDDETKKIHVDGLKDELDKSYAEISENLKQLEGQVAHIDSETEEKYSNFIAGEEEKYSTVFNKIRDLLPDALTAGLSHAYSEKKEAELKESIKLKQTFLNAIKWLVVVSLIPFAVNIYLLIDGKSLESIINDLPKMVFSILPLYIPIVWLAYSAGKKVNLSKRLVEEYSHKEVLSKTFEGLSSQIEDLGESDISSELRLKLLSNILSVSAENPGKLISDYNSGDHPFFDGGIPFFSKAKKEVSKKVKKAEVVAAEVIDDILTD